MKSFVIIDGTGLIYRGFYALPAYLKDAKGYPTNAVYGFTSMLFNVLLERAPDYIAVSFDLKGPTFRHEEYKEYKATRTPAPQELYDQIPRVKEVVRTIGIPIFEVQGVEADDVLATLAREAESWDHVHTYILTGDMDMMQTVNESTSILYPNKGFKEADILGPAETMAKMGVRPDQITDYKGLCGDNSDNLPGVPGVGPKTAIDLLVKYDHFENIYEHLDELSPGVRKKMEAGRESGELSKHMATLKYDVPLQYSKEDLQTPALTYGRLKPLFEELGFQSFLKRLAAESQATLL